MKEKKADSAKGEPDTATTSSIATLSTTPTSTPLSTVSVEHPHHCPLDRDALGRSTWGLLHTMAAAYPEKPSNDDRKGVTSFMTLLGKLYPCEHCAKDLRDDLAKDPPKTDNQNSLAQWMCRLHNRVNEKLGKDTFDCSKVNERWRDGPKDGSCG